MSARVQALLHLVLYEGPAVPLFAADDRLALLTALLEKGFGVSRVGSVGSLASAADQPLLVLGRFQDGQPPPAEAAHRSLAIRFQDVTGLKADQVVSLVEAVRAEWDAAGPDGWLPWFPVIDYDRCTQCLQCLGFCLFDVYGVDAKRRIQVQRAANCKPNCPACSRVCPEAAIIFPKYKSSPINGELISDADWQREKMKIDISTLLGGDIYSLLRDRSERAKSRFSKERDPDKALQERRKCLAKLAQAAEVPTEVLMSLPSPEEIQRRADEVKAKAHAALQNERSAGRISVS
jgi:NAD-dependent dihydropyrimidine dehydrogenase PreA subunit